LHAILRGILIVTTLQRRHVSLGAPAPRRRGS
jgi:hypothetical protein